MPKDAGHLVSSRASDEGEAARLAEFKRKLWYVEVSYRFARQVEATFPSLNESLVLLAKATNPRAHRAEKARRPHPEIGLWVNRIWRARQEAARRDPDARAPTQPEIFDICVELTRKVKARRGRPADRILAHHVQGLMVLIERLSGAPVRAAKTRNGEYAPHMISSGGRIIENLFSWIDPQVTTTALADIILHARATGGITGRTFRDYFPGYDWGIDPETGMPVPAEGQRLESFRLTPQIYCS
jgi:hypothetical protein